MYVLEINIIKFLCKKMNCQKKQIKKLIKTEQIYLNQKVVISYDIVLKVDDIVKVNKLEFKNSKPKIIVLNKPQAFECSTINEKYLSVYELLPDIYKKFIMVGRLDMNTTGILLFTDDGSYSNYLTNPKSNKPKKYFVKLKSIITSEQIEELNSGVTIYENILIEKCKIEIIDNYSLYLTIYEGKYHQIKVMFKAVDNYVQQLHRIEFDKYKLTPDIEIGTCKKIDFIL